MSKVYESKPNIVKVTVEDENGSQERHVVGYTLEEVLETVTLSLDGAEQTAGIIVTPKKTRKPRKAKVEAVPVQTDEAEPIPAGGRWP